MKNPCKTTRKKSPLPPNRILMGVTKYSFRVLAGMPDAPLDPPNHLQSTRVIRIYGNSKPAGWSFSAYVYPNGSKLDKAFLRQNEGVVEMSIHESQFASVIGVLTGSNEAYALYEFGAEQVGSAEIQGNFTKPPQPALPAPPKAGGKRKV